MQFTVQRPKNFIPAIGKVWFKATRPWRRWRISRRIFQNRLHTLDMSFEFGTIDYETYKRERDIAKGYKLPR